MTTLPQDKENQVVVRNITLQSTQLHLLIWKLNTFSSTLWNFKPLNMFTSQNLSKNEKDKKNPNQIKPKQTGRKKAYSPQVKWISSLHWTLKKPENWYLTSSAWSLRILKSLSFNSLMSYITHTKQTSKQIKNQKTPHFFSFIPSDINISSYLFKSVDSSG